MYKLSIKQKQVVEAIEYFINTYHYSPTYRELAKLLQCDVNTVFKKIVILEEKGYIKTTNGKSRSIIICKKIEEEDI